MYVIATAGHVDHGKSTLVRALTGMEPDRWAEERRRGMTIDLGFAWMTLPSGERLAFVDVPGHERFVTNMLAGVGPVPAVMFVVAADGGWMPQSAEHLEAIAALGVRHCVLVVTRADLADPGLALRQAGREFAARDIPHVEALAVSCQTGAGVDKLIAALNRLVTRLPSPDRLAPVRLWVDRVFTIRGSGTVVTGTLPTGMIRSGDELMLAPSGRRIRVRGLESMKEHTESVAAIARVAANIRGAERAEIGRGAALFTPDHWTVTDLIDVALHPVGGSPDEAVKLPQEMTLHVGSARISARTRVLRAGSSGPAIARLGMSAPLPLHVGDRALLRDGNQRRGQRRIIGITVLDVLPPQALRRRGAAAERGRILMASSNAPDGRFHLSQHGLLRRGNLIAMGCEPPSAPVAGDWVADPDHWAALGQRLRKIVGEYSADHPLQPGMPAEVARQQLGLPDHQLVEALARPPLRLADGRVFSGQSRSRLPDKIAAAVERVRRELGAHPFHAPDAERLAELGLGRKELSAASRAGRLLCVAESIVLLPGADADAARTLARLPQPFTASEARQALDTTRRVAIPLLEYLDRQGHTERVSETHRRCLPGGPANAPGAGKAT
jgi:selenocysteine-specific elongation factor